jgi:hypothetical protein
MDQTILKKKSKESNLLNISEKNKIKNKQTKPNKQTTKKKQTNK